MPPPPPRLRGAAAAFAGLPSLALFPLFFLAVALAHWTLLRLPYYWDEGGYYIPAALDFFRTGTLIPHFTNAHPPLPSILLGTLWRVVGFHILATRLLVCAFAAGALVAVFRLTQRLLGAVAAVATTLLTAIYPIWFAQSSLAHADMFAAAFTLWAFAVYFEATVFRESRPPVHRNRARLLVAVLFTLAALSKETAIVQPSALAAMELAFFLRDRRVRADRPNHPTDHLKWTAALLAPVLPLAAWFAYHRARTGFAFGNPEYLRYNATANLTASHIVTSLYYRSLHLFWQRNMWFPLVLAVACLFLPRRVCGPAGAANAVPPSEQKTALGLPRSAATTIAVLVLANWVAFSILGGALLTRYLLPIYPLLLLVCVVVWQSRTARWPMLVAATAASFLMALWMNPPAAFAPEDNLTYRDMIVVHQEAIAFVNQHYPNATVLTAWPVSTDFFNPDLGYTDRPAKVFAIENFTLPEVRKAAEQPGRFDTAIVFTTNYVSPALRAYWLAHPDSRRGREFAAGRDLTPPEIAAILGGTIVWHDDRHGEWAAVLRFDRSYEAQLTPPSR